MIELNSEMMSQWQIKDFKDSVGRGKGDILWVWGKNLLFGKMIVQNYMDTKEIGPGACP